MDIDELVERCNKEGVSAVARSLHYTKQAIYKRVKNHPNYNPPKPPKPSDCPRCGCTHIWANGRYKNKRQYICASCKYMWRERLMEATVSEILKKL